MADIAREEEFLKTKLTSKHKTLIQKYSGGLHGVIGALAYFLKQNPEIKDVRQLKTIVFEDKMFRFWIEDILQSLPAKSLRILKDVVSYPQNFTKYRRDIYARWLVDLGFVNSRGKFLHPLMEPIVSSFQGDSEEKKLKFRGNQFYFRGEKLELTKKERGVLELFFRNQGKLVSYDNIGKVLWPDNPDKFSLWAIAQVVRRLRKKLALYTFHPDTINSQRGQGYRFAKL